MVQRSMSLILHMLRRGFLFTWRFTRLSIPCSLIAWLLSLMDGHWNRSTVGNSSIRRFLYSIIISTNYITFCCNALIILLHPWYLVIFLIPPFFYVFLFCPGMTLLLWCCTMLGITMESSWMPRRTRFACSSPCSSFFLIYLYWFFFAARASGFCFNAFSTAFTSLS